jgi:hypothetical protein
MKWVSFAVAIIQPAKLQIRALLRLGRRHAGLKSAASLGASGETREAPTASNRRRERTSQEHERRTAPMINGLCLA